MRRRVAALLGRLFSEELARGASVNLGFTVVNLVAQLVAGLTLAVYLGPAGVGAFAIGMLVLDNVNVLVHLPGAAFVREFAASEKEEALATVAGIKLLLCIPACATVLIVAGPLSALFQVPENMVRVLAAYPPLSAVASIGTMVFESRRKMVRRNLPSLAENIGRLAAVLFLSTGATVLASRPESAALAFVLGAAPAVAVSFLLAGFPDVRRMNPSRARAYFSFGWRTTLAQLLQKQLLWVGTAAVYLAYLGASLPLAQAESGLFKTAYSLMFYIVLVGSAVPIMLYPLLSRAFTLPHAGEQRAEAHRLLSLAFYYELMLSVPLALGLVALGPWAFTTVLPGFAPAALTAQLLSLSGVLFCIMLPPTVLLTAANRPDLTLRLFLLMAAVAVTLNALLVPQIGSPWGGAMGAIIADWATAAAGLLYALLLCKSIGVPAPSFARFRDSLGARRAKAPQGPDP
jgi:O-antigen/teichoic acid export membrane protein